MKIITSDMVMFYKKSFFSKKWKNYFFTLTSEGILTRYKDQNETDPEDAMDITKSAILTGDDAIRLDDRPPLDIWQDGYLLMCIPFTRTKNWWLMFQTYEQRANWMENIALVFKGQALQKDFLIRNQCNQNISEERFCELQNALKYRTESKNLPTCVDNSSNIKCVPVTQTVPCVPVQTTQQQGKPYTQPVTQTAHCVPVQTTQQQGYTVCQEVRGPLPQFVPSKPLYTTYGQSKVYHDWDGIFNECYDPWKEERRRLSSHYSVRRSYSSGNLSDPCRDGLDYQSPDPCDPCETNIPIYAENRRSYNTLDCNDNINNDSLRQSSNQSHSFRIEDRCRTRDRSTPYSYKVDDRLRPRETSENFRSTENIYTKEPCYETNNVNKGILKKSRENIVTSSSSNNQNYTTSNSRSTSVHFSEPECEGKVFHSSKNLNVENKENRGEPDIGVNVKVTRTYRDSNREPDYHEIRHHF